MDPIPSTDLDEMPSANAAEYDQDTRAKDNLEIIEELRPGSETVTQPLPKKTTDVEEEELEVEGSNLEKSCSSTEDNMLVCDMEAQQKCVEEPQYQEQLSFEQDKDHSTRGNDVALESKSEEENPGIKALEEISVASPKGDQEYSTDEESHLEKSSFEEYHPTDDFQVENSSHEIEQLPVQANVGEIGKEEITEELLKSEDKETPNLSESLSKDDGLKHNEQHEIQGEYDEFSKSDSQLIDVQEISAENVKEEEFISDAHGALMSENRPVEKSDPSVNDSLNDSAGKLDTSNNLVTTPKPPAQLAYSSTSPSSKVETTPPGDVLHHIKNIHFKDKKVGIVTQNENGPCPLVAIINVLLLRHQITLPAIPEIVSAAKLMEYIGNAMLESVPKNLSGDIRLNYEQNMNDAMAVLPKLQTGLDVNVKFTGVKDFEYTPECIIFDLLSIPLYHGWLADPQTPEVVSAVGQAGYNQLVEKVVSQQGSSNEDAALEAIVIENFLQGSASQLTYHGLCELTTKMKEDEIGVLFRNNHFSTIYKHKEILLQLVTDQGFLGEPNVVWETLSSIDGDGQFVDSNFREVPPKPEHNTSCGSASPNTSAQLTAEQQIDHDFLVALSLQEEQQQEHPAAMHDEIGDVGEDVAKTLAEDEKNAQELLDLAFAQQLQEEEERRAAEAESAAREGNAQQAPSATGSRTPPQPSKKKDNCTFL